MWKIPSWATSQDIIEETQRWYQYFKWMFKVIPKWLKDNNVLSGHHKAQKIWGRSEKMSANTEANKHVSICWCFRVSVAPFTYALQPWLHQDFIQRSFMCEHKGQIFGSLVVIRVNLISEYKRKNSRVDRRAGSGKLMQKRTRRREISTQW